MNKLNGIMKSVKIFNYFLPHQVNIYQKNLSIVFDEVDNAEGQHTFRIRNLSPIDNLLQTRSQYFKHKMELDLINSRQSQEPLHKLLNELITCFLVNGSRQ